MKNFVKMLVSAIGGLQRYVRRYHVRRIGQSVCSSECSSSPVCGYDIWRVRL